MVNDMEQVSMYATCTNELILYIASLWLRQDTRINKIKDNSWIGLDVWMGRMEWSEGEKGVVGRGKDVSWVFYSYRLSSLLYSVEAAEVWQWSIINQGHLWLPQDLGSIKAPSNITPRSRPSVVTEGLTLVQIKAAFVHEPLQVGLNPRIENWPCSMIGWPTS
jgi:hypothetical protein